MGLPTAGADDGTAAVLQSLVDQRCYPVEGAEPFIASLPGSTDCETGAAGAVVVSCCVSVPVYNGPREPELNPISL